MTQTSQSPVLLRDYEYKLSRIPARPRVRVSLSLSRRQRLTPMLNCRPWGVDSYLGITVHFANNKEKRHQSLRIGLYLPYLYVNHFHRFLFSLLPVQLCPQRESKSWEAPGDSQKVLHRPSTASLTLPSIWSEVAFSCLIAFTGN